MSSTAVARSLFGGDGHELAALVTDQAEEEGIEQAVPRVGDLFWYSLPTLRVAPEELAAVYERAGIDRRYLPGAIRAADAFRRATSGLERAADLTAGGATQHFSLLVREAANTKERTVRQVVAEVRDAAQVRLAYTPAGQFELGKADEHAEAFELDGIYELPTAARDLVREALAAFPGAFADALNLLDDGHVRRALDSLMQAEHVIGVRPSGGVYFALHGRRALVEQLDRLFAALRSVAEGARFCAVPVIDVARQRRMVAEATLAHVRGEVDSLVREVDQILTEQGQGRKVRESTAERYLGELRRIGQMVEEYRSATRDRMAEAGGALDLLRVQGATLASVAE